MNLNNKKGAALVEMAIILPLLLLIVVGIFEFGRAMLIRNTLNNAAREGARRAAVSPPPVNIDAFVRSAIPFNQTGLVITPNPSSPTPGSGAPVTVTIMLPFHTVTGLIPVLDGMILSGQATMRYEYVAP
ncbi:MAG TPA: TadE/TadG family type IV pilus assembly protein [Desulfuromonadaceae bacterium]|jgi:Flp pilus assembly protein TadG